MDIAYPISLTVHERPAGEYKCSLHCVKLVNCPKKSPRYSLRRTRRLKAKDTATYFCGVSEDFKDFVRDCLCVLPLDPLSPLVWLYGEFKDAHGEIFMKVWRSCPNQPPGEWLWYLNNHELPKTSAGF